MSCQEIVPTRWKIRNLAVEGAVDRRRPMQELGVQLVAGGVAGLADALLLHGFDTLKGKSRHFELLLLLRCCVHCILLNRVLWNSTC